MSELHYAANHFVCISGFTQGEGEQTGMMELWMQLGALQFPPLHKPGTFVHFRPWHTDWRDFAEYIHLASVHDPSIVVFAYSYGGGFGFIQLAKQLARRDLRIRCAVLSDAVYRHRYLLGQWRAFLPWTKIKVPPNVKEVYWFRQKTNYPMGHDIVAENPDGTLVHMPVIVPSDHAHMDDNNRFYEKCLEVAGVGPFQRATVTPEPEPGPPLPGPGPIDMPEEPK